MENKCARFGRIDLHVEYELTGTETREKRFGPISVKVTSVEEPYSHQQPTSSATDCIIGRSANELKGNILDGDYEYTPNPSIGCSGYCRGCDKNFSFTVKAERLPNS